MKSNYEIFDPKVDKPLHELSRKEAETAFDWFIANRKKRLECLIQFAAYCGVPIDFEVGSIDQLDRLLVSEIRKVGLEQYRRLMYFRCVVTSAFFWQSC